MSMSENDKIIDSTCNGEINHNLYNTYSKEFFRHSRSWNTSSITLREITKSCEDVYGNIKYDLLNSDGKAQSRVNILKLFRPGEFLNYLIDF